MQNIPNVKMGLISVSRSCFPVALSQRRREAVAAAYAQHGEIYACPITVETQTDAQKAVADVKVVVARAVIVAGAKIAVGAVVVAHAVVTSIAFLVAARVACRDPIRIAGKIVHVYMCSE